jgi:hypothetical protein
MKFLAIVLSALCFQALAETPTAPVRLSEPVEVTDRFETFGVPMPEAARTMTLSELIAAGDEYVDREVVVDTRIAKVCQKKGCFFIAHEGADSARVTFKDYGFFIPTNAGGKTVRVAGVLTRSEVSDKEARHYADDLGEAAGRAAPRQEYVIIATSVRIPLADRG